MEKFIYIKPVSLTLLLGSLLTTPLVIPMLKEALSSQFVKFSGHSTCAVDLAGFFFPHRYHWTKPTIINSLINMSYKANFWESAAFMGYLVLPMAIWAVIKKKFPLKGYFILVSLIGMILSLGSFPHIFGMPITFIKLPVHIFEQIPVLNAARSPSRFVFLSYFSLSICAAVASDEWFKYLKKNRSRTAFKIGVIGLPLAILLDFWSIPFEVSKIGVPEYYYCLKSDESNFAIVNIPLVGWLANERYMYYQTIHNKPICGGQLARSSLRYFEKFENDPLSKSDLETLKVKYVILHKEFIDHSSYKKSYDKLAKRFQLFAQEKDSAVFKVY